jgi:hypothetical protein
LAAQSSIATDRELIAYRSAAIDAAASIESTPTRELLRSVVITAVTDIQATPPWNYFGGTLSSYSGGNDFTYLAGTASTYGPDPGWSYGGTASPTYTYGG